MHEAAAAAGTQWENDWKYMRSPLHAAAYVHDKRRNRLKPDAVTKLVFIYTTIRACLEHRSYKRHLQFMDGTAASPGNIVSHEDRVDGNASDNDNTDLEDYTNNSNSDYEEDL